MLTHGRTYRVNDCITLTKKNNDRERLLSICSHMVEQIPDLIDCIMLTKKNNDREIVIHMLTHGRTIIYPT